MDEIDIPQYFICPISLQIMKDPVTAVTGITYDRESIELWMITAAADNITAMCPVTKQPLPHDSDLTPNHMLRKLIQAWCIVNAKNGIDRIPTPKFPLHESIVLKLMRDANNTRNTIILRINALKKMDELAKESEKNRSCMAGAGVAKAMILFISRCFRESTNSLLGVEEALRLLQVTWNPNSEMKQIVEENMDLIQSLLWISKNPDIKNIVIKTHALIVLKNIVEIISSNLVDNLEPHFIKQVVTILNETHKISPLATKAVLHILISTCKSGRNKIVITESGIISDLIEMELAIPDKKTSDLIFCLLAHLCSCADGRQQFLRHAGGIAVTAKRLLRISPTTDDFSLSIIDFLARYAATQEVVNEMLRVGAVTKLCMVLQADCADYLKKRAREILRMHSNVWSDSPCIQVYLLTRFAR